MANEAEIRYDSVLTAREVAICVGFDAMRIALGTPPKNFTYNEVIEWLRLVGRP
jgi:hypothetical protein